MRKILFCIVSLLFIAINIFPQSSAEFNYFQYQNIEPYKKDKPKFIVFRNKNREKKLTKEFGKFSRVDNFEYNTLDTCWQMIQTNRGDWYDLKNGQLFLNTIPKNIYELQQPAFLGFKQQNRSFEVTTEFNFQPQSEQEIAGLVCFQNIKNNFVFGKTILNGNQVIVIDRSSQGTKRIVTYAIPSKFQNSSIKLKIKGDGTKYSFFVSYSNDSWHSVAENVDATNLSFQNDGDSEVKSETLIGPYASSYAQSKELKKVYADYFPIGVAVSESNLLGKEKEILLKHFSSLTAENAMKPENLLLKNGTYNWSDVDKIANFAQENKLLMRGHVLVWHNQTPDWFFKNEKGEYVDSTIMYKRMEKYMTDVMTHFKPYVYCWDVVNEAISDKENEDYRINSGWYKTCGTAYIEKAFRRAHKIDPNVKLFYNDYNLIDPIKREKVYNMIRGLLKRGTPINGIGIQGHWSIQDINTDEIQKTIDLFSSLGLDIQITELDLTIYGTYHGAGASIQSKETRQFSYCLEKMQAEKYKQIFEILRRNKDKISAVTFWGLADNQTWLSNFPIPGRTDYPLLFDRNLNPKLAFNLITDF